jgi:hypothetical protein
LDSSEKPYLKNGIDTKHPSPKIVGIWIRLQLLIQLDAALDAQIRQNPVRRCERTPLPKERLEEPSDPRLMPAQPKVIEAEVVELFQELDVEPVEDDDGDGQDAEEAGVPQGGAVSCTAHNDEDMLTTDSRGVGTKNGRRHILMLMKDDERW